MNPDQIRAALAKCEAQYQRKMNASAMIPPSIRQSALAGIAKKMDKLEAMLEKVTK